MCLFWLYSYSTVARSNFISHHGGHEDTFCAVAPCACFNQSFSSCFQVATLGEESTLYGSPLWIRFMQLHRKSMGLCMEGLQESTGPLFSLQLSSWTRLHIILWTARQPSAQLVDILHYSAMQSPCDSWEVGSYLLSVFSVFMRSVLVSSVGVHIHSTCTCWCLVRIWVAINGKAQQNAVGSDVTWLASLYQPIQIRHLDSDNLQFKF